MSCSTLDLDYEMVMQLIDKFTQRGNVYRAKYIKEYLHFEKQGGYDVLDEVRRIYGIDALIDLLASNIVYYDMSSMSRKTMGEFNDGTTKLFITPLTHGFDQISLRYKSFKENNKLRYDRHSAYATHIMRHEVSHALAGIPFTGYYYNELNEKFAFHKGLCEGLTELSVLKMNKDDAQYIYNYRIYVIRTYESMAILADKEDTTIDDLFFRLSVKNVNKTDLEALSKNLVDIYDQFASYSVSSKLNDEFRATPFSEINTYGNNAAEQFVCEAFKIICGKWVT